jgi:hypothetical protein
LILALTLIPLPARSQAEIRLARMEVALWPEYDKPSMLVLYMAALPAEVTLPVELTFRIPVSAGDPHAVAIQQPGGSLMTASFTRQVSGEWALITFTATSPQIRLEYYDPALSKEGRQRRFEFTWPGDYAVDSFNIEVQQPTGASDMVISSVTASTSQGQDGLVYHTAEVGTFEVGEPFTITVQYQKDGDALSADDLEVLPSAPLSTEDSLRFDPRGLLPWILGVLGLALLAGGGWWFWRSSREETPARDRKRRRAASRPMETSSTGAGITNDAIYCHQCGKRAAPGDRFCRSCGARLRVE